MSRPRETSFMSTVIDLSPAKAGSRFDDWASRLLTSHAAACDEGHVVVNLDQKRLGLSDDRDWAPMRSASGQLRTSRRSLGGIVLELNAWSAIRTEIAIRHTGQGINPGAHYFAIGHTALSELSQALMFDGSAHPARMFKAAGVEPLRASALGRLTRLAAASR